MVLVPMELPGHVLEARMSNRSPHEARMSDRGPHVRHSRKCEWKSGVDWIICHGLLEISSSIHPHIKSSITLHQQSEWSSMAKLYGRTHRVENPNTTRRRVGIEISIPIPELLLDHSSFHLELRFKLPLFRQKGVTLRLQLLKFSDCLLLFSSSWHYSTMLKLWQIFMSIINPTQPSSISWTRAWQFY